MTLEKSKNKARRVYLYGFNGMYKDNEVYGSGNAYNFGARMYNPRLGRWFSTDRYERLYVPIAPYVFALNNPLKFKDADGNVVVDENGNPVTITVVKNEDGTYSASYGFASNTSEKVRKNFMENGGRLINTLIQVETGRSLVQKAINSQNDIHIVISPESHITQSKSDDKTTTSGKLGDTEITLRIVDGETGNTQKVNFQTTIYEGSINEISKLGGIEKYNKNDLNQNQKVAVTGAHEIEHTTNPIDVKAAIEGRDLTTEEHQAANNKGTQVAKEFGKLNSEYDE